MKNCDPATLAEPKREAYGPLADYLAAWYLWRAIRRDCEMSPQEARVAWDTRIDLTVKKLAYRTRKRQ